MDTTQQQNPFFELATQQQALPPQDRKVRVYGVDFDERFIAELIVEMRDAKGLAWTALYTLIRQPDDLWRISGCVLRRGLGKAV